MGQSCEANSLQYIQPKKILICQQRQIGDVVLATPAITVLKKAYPTADIHFFTEKRSAPVLENNPNLEHVWEIDKKASFMAKLRMLFAIRNEGFDLVVAFQQLPRCQRATFFSGAKYRLSYTPNWYNKPFYTHWIDMLGGYAVKAKLSVLRPLGLEWNNERPRIYLTEQEQLEALQFLYELGLTQEKQLITVDATHWSDTRRWPAEYFASLLDKIAEHDNSSFFVLLYGPGEKEQADAVFQLMQHKGQCFVPQTLLGLRRSIAIQSHAHVHLGNCSAPRHFALAVGTPTLTVIGSNSGGSWTFPAPDQGFVDNRPECAPCSNNTCRTGTFQCLRGLTPEMVFEKYCRRGF